jgi:CheY-like chemotaxis protein
LAPGPGRRFVAEFHLGFSIECAIILSVDEECRREAMAIKGEILIIDDDADFCEIAKTALEADSFSVRCASTGLQGLAMMREKKPGLVFLDVIMIMPDEGVYVSREIAQDPALRDVPVVMVSSVADSEYAGYFPTDQPLHVRMFLDKPVPLAKLLEVANRLVQEQQAGT